jgi:hypothetical protein
VFIRGTDVITGVYTVRVIGFDIQGNCQDDIIARPNFVDGDGLPGHDLISDANQGYALVVSGNVVTDHGQLLFDKGQYACGDAAIVRLEDSNIGAGTEMTVTVRTSAGDCDVFPLIGASPFFATAAFPIADLPDPAPTRGCEDGVGDGVVMVGDDGWISATFRDLPGGGADPIIVRAAARSACRDVALVSVEVAHPCGSSMSTTTLDLGAEATLTVTLSQIAGPLVGGLWGELFPFDDRVHAGPPSSAVFSVPPDAFVGTFRVTVDDAFGLHCYSPLRFRLELHGENGFRDRVYFDVNESCAVGTVTPPTRPGEVTGFRVEEGLPPNHDQQQDTLFLSFVPPTPPPLGTHTFNVWRGDLGLLIRGTYSHVIPDDTFSGSALVWACDVTASPAVIDNGAVPGLDPAPLERSYFLVTAEALCGSMGSLDGPWGHPDANADAIDDVPEIPAGRRADPDCQ